MLTNKKLDVATTWMIGKMEYSNLYFKIIKLLMCIKMHIEKFFNSVAGQNMFKKRILIQIFMSGFKIMFKKK